MKIPPNALRISGGERLQVHIAQSSGSAIEQRVVSPARFRLRNFDAVVSVVSIDRRAVKTCLLQASSDIQPRIRSVPVTDEAFVVHIEDNTSFNRDTHVEDDVGISFVLKEELGECFQHFLVGCVSFHHVYHLRQNVGFHPRVHGSLNGASGVEGFYLPAILVDDRADGECLSPQTVGFYIPRKYFVCHFYVLLYIKFDGIRYT